MSIKGVFEMEDKTSMLRKTENMLHPITFSDSDIQALKTLLENCDGVEYFYNRELSGIWLYDGTREAELRLLILLNFRLTVSRVGFLRQRQGTMTKVMAILDDFCRREKISEIVIQSVETRAMSNWCFKNGFRPVPSASLEIDGFVIGDYKKNIE